MVWLYGGQWKYGWSGMAHYDGATLARSGVVVVAVDYRVGFEGFGHLPGVPDNRGLRDQLAALEWVHREISAFGGDPGNVTVFGQSAGAASAVLLAAAPAAEGLFQRAIAQSIPRGERTAAEAEAITGKLAQAAGVSPTLERFAALPPEAIPAVQDAPMAGAGGSAFGPVIDGDLVPGGRWRPRRGVDLICGFTREEFRGIAPGVGDAELIAKLSAEIVQTPTTRVAEAHAEAGGRTWLYDFAWRGPALGTCHGIDMPFTFGIGDSPFAARLLGSPPPPGFGALSERIRAAWTSFAATGDPGWPRFDLNERTIRVWDTTTIDARHRDPGAP